MSWTPRALQAAGCVEAASEIILLAPISVIYKWVEDLPALAKLLPPPPLLSSQNTGCVFSKVNLSASICSLISGCTGHRPHQRVPFSLKGNSGRVPKEPSRFWKRVGLPFPTSLSRFGHSSHQQGRSQLRDITSKCRGSRKSTTCQH